MVARGRPSPLTISVRTLDVLARRMLAARGPWTVHSAFARAINLVALNGDLLGIVEAAGGNGPATLVLDEVDATWADDGGQAADDGGRAGQACRTGQAPPRQCVLGERVAAGDPVHFDADMLRIGDRLVLDLAAASLWQPPPIVRQTPGAEIERRLTQAAEIGARYAPEGGLAPLLPQAIGIARGVDDGQDAASDGDLVVQQARQSLSELLAAAREHRWADASNPARALSGLGPGLTPAGDDVLAGLVLGLRAAWGTLPALLARALVQAVVDRTTDLAVARVRYAVAGHPDERSHRLLAALVMDPTDAGLEVVIRAMLAFGHSSGADTLVGVLAGAAVGIVTPAAPQTPEA